MIELSFDLLICQLKFVLKFTYKLVKGLMELMYCVVQ